MEHPFVEDLKNKITLKKNKIFVVMGPRQVGKTTGVLNLESQLKGFNFCYKSADSNLSYNPSWLLEQWIACRQESNHKNKIPLLIIDEIQKVEQWSEIVKKLWDEEIRNGTGFQCVLLGSSSLQVQKGLSESLAGRFELVLVYHWSPSESQKILDLSLDQYLKYGGYPGSYEYVNSKLDWINFIQHSIVEPVLGKDILILQRVKSPALFRQCFDLVCSYPSQEISYTKLLGQLQEEGNVELVKHYLELLEGAFLIRQIYKFSSKKIVYRTSSPKLIPACPALYSLTLDVDLGAEEIGRSFELIIGNLLLRKVGKLFYWREGNFEIDFVYQFGKEIFGIEVKSGRKKNSKSLNEFLKKYPKVQIVIVTMENFEKIIDGLPG